VEGLWLVVILLVAAAVRFWKLGSLPPAIFRDEAEKALNGWFLLNDGVDEQGRPWPLFVKVFGVTTSAIYQYATIPFLALGGLNEWTARMPAAMVGVLTVLFTWLFCRRVWGWQVAAWAAGLLAISPWHVPLSRWAQQGVFLPLLFVMAAWGVAALRATRELRIMNYELRIEESASQTEEGMKGREAARAARQLRITNYELRIEGSASQTEERIKEQRGEWQGSLSLAVGAVCLGLAMYAYDPARLFAPLLGLLGAVIWWRVWIVRWRAVLAAGVVFALMVSPVVWLLVIHGDEAQARFRFLSVFRPGVSVGEGLLAFLGNYFSHFSPGFLLVSGDRELRHSGGVGMLNLVGFAFALAGTWVAVRRRCRWGWFMIGWVLLAPVAASLTREGVPHALRSQMALPAWQVLAGVGISAAVQRFDETRRRAVGQMVALGILLSAMPFFFSYFGSYAARSAVNWQYGVKQALQFLNNPGTKNSRVVLQESVVGANYLVPFYLGMNREEFNEMKTGFGRYRVLPFMGGASVFPPDRQPPPFEGGPMAWVGVPGYGGSEGAAVVPIHAPGGEEIPPVMLIYMNDELAMQVTGNQ